VAIDDPELTYSAPPAVTAATGIDVLCHAVEAYVSIKATPVTDAMSQEAIRLVGKYLPIAVVDGKNSEARAQMMLANAFAGFGLACCGATIMHGLEHPVSGHYPEVAHGAGLAAMLKPWARKLWSHMPEKFARITELLTEECLADVEDAAARAGDAIEGLLEQVGLNVQLRDLGVEETNLPTMAADTCRYMAGAVTSTPGELCAEEVLELLQAAF
jgi:alcohol dehydrogenase class IV